jgi:hypothetical protein
MNIRKEKEKEFFTKHLEIFRILGNPDPFFLIKTAFFQKGKYGRHFQLFESEIGKGEDIYLEFYDNVNDDKGNLIDVVPFSEDRQLFKYKYNPFYGEEYEYKEGTNFKGEPFILYTIPVSELVAVLDDGTEITYALYEKRKASGTVKEDLEDSLPRLQKSLFPDFEEEFPKTDREGSLDEIYNAEIADAPLSEITIRDLAAIMLMKPVSARPWLNDLIKQTKSEI